MNSIPPGGPPKKRRTPARAARRARGSWGSPWGSRTRGDRWGGSTGLQPTGDPGKRARSPGGRRGPCRSCRRRGGIPPARGSAAGCGDRKSTRLNSSHVKISYAVFCLKKKTKKPKQYLLNKKKQKKATTK